METTELIAGVLIATWVAIIGYVLALWRQRLVGRQEWQRLFRSLCIEITWNAEYFEKYLLERFRTGTFQPTSDSPFLDKTLTEAIAYLSKRPEYRGFFLDLLEIKNQMNAVRSLWHDVADSDYLKEYHNIARRDREIDMPTLDREDVYLQTVSIHDQIDPVYKEALMELQTLVSGIYSLRDWWTACLYRLTYDSWLGPGKKGIDEAVAIWGPKIRGLDIGEFASTMTYAPRNPD
jgi:hypothetical protein